MPTLSAIMCNYNHGQHIAKAITAIATQSRPPDEFIIVEDGSTDNSVAAIEPYVRKYPFIKFLQNPSNKGLMYSFDRALTAASGDFIYGASADDYILPGFFEKAMHAAQLHPESGVIMGAYRTETSRGRYVGEVRFDNWNHKGFQSAEVFKKYLFLHPCLVPTCSAIYNRKEFIAVGGCRPELGPTSDLFALHSILMKTGGVYIPETFAINVERSDSYSKAFHRNPKRIHDNIDALVALMRSPEFSGRFSPEHATQFNLYARLVLCPFDPEVSALVPMNLHHVRLAFLSLATWDSPIAMIAALFMKNALALKKIFESRP